MIYVPQIDGSVIDCPNRGDKLRYATVAISFSPKQKKYGGLFKGDVAGHGPLYESCLSKDYLPFAKFAIDFYAGSYRDNANTYSTCTLLKFYSYRKFRVVYLYAIKESIIRFRNILRNKLRPLEIAKSKYEVFQAIFKISSTLDEGIFERGELIAKLIPKNDFIGIVSGRVIYNSIDLILNSAVDEGELKVVNKGQSNRRFRLTSKGMSFYTETKERYKQDIAILELQKSQVRTQKWIVFLTCVLAFATVLSLVDKVEQIKNIYNSLISLF
ncbi:hypothetical protein DS891_23980 [Pseudoalteromonas sp. JC28]|uniref:hypothetical protein n=1 Tax=Pseudoalteromonas sp. JC28 TaxID=2267617 RepID=UPI0015718EA8|nr:hypothetical protein [Pseudoalteromonas sp. JC28]NSY36547.1 hypothetical protein [Pseudoalteromonas sp. JC28]